MTYLESRADVALVLVGEAAGYRGARISGLPFTSERQLTGVGPGEATATIVHRVLGELCLEDHVLLWNVVPTHPHRSDDACSNRRPALAEVEAAAPFLAEIVHGRQPVAVGRLAHAVLGGTYVRHPSRGGATAFRAALAELLGPKDATQGIPGVATQGMPVLGRREPLAIALNGAPGRSG